MAAPPRANRATRPSERSRHADGALAEEVVARFLESQGYAIVATNLRIGRLELDVVARRDRVVAVVEVRTRGASAWTTPFGSIDGRKRSRIRRAGERLWQRRYQKDGSVDHLRFDAASVRLDRNPPEVEYVVAAF